MTDADVIESSGTEPTSGASSEASAASGVPLVLDAGLVTWRSRGVSSCWCRWPRSTTTKARFPDAARLDVIRRSSGHLGFGHGIHYCVGAPLARLEGEIAFRRMLDRFPKLSLAVEPGDVRWRQGSLFRGLERLPVRLS